MEKRSNLFVVIFLCSFIFQFGCESPKTGNEINADVIIYGGTSAAITAAVPLARMDKKVIIVCPEKHIGGLSASGLGFTDIGDKSVIGGLSREFYQRVYNEYDKEETWRWQAREDYGNEGQGTAAIDGDQKTMWIFEPHIAERIFEDFIDEYKIKVIRDKWLDRENGVEMKDGKIVSITMLSGEKCTAKIFVDATYEGDLMAAAGVNYYVGRESSSIYNEEWNGVQAGFFHHGHNFGILNIDPYVIPGDPTSGVLPRISTEPIQDRGAGDNQVQAYCYRTCLTNVPENSAPFERPENYDSTQYELLVRILEAGWSGTLGGGKIPNNKRDVNNRGPFSSDNIGMNYDYPEASYERRKEILEEHITYQKGFYYFYSTDPRVPQEVQDDLNTWGYAKDEFLDNGHWPYQIYVREARKMIGEFVMTENEILGRSEVIKPIGMGSYTMDSHNTQRYITPEGYVQNEGDLGVEPGQPYQIHLGTILPKKAECKNLIVPVAVSSSHIAFGSIRMEPVFMILGQSSAVIAAMALEKGMDIHDLDYDEMKTELIACGQILNSGEGYATEQTVNICLLQINKTIPSTFDFKDLNSTLEVDRITALPEYMDISTADSLIYFGGTYFEYYKKSGQCKLKVIVLDDKIKTITINEFELNQTTTFEDIKEIFPVACSEAHLIKISGDETEYTTCSVGLRTPGGVLLDEKLLFFFSNDKLKRIDI